jgi:lysophospholipase L1-like esterase
MAGAGGEAPPPREDLGKGDGHDVVTIGDSWMSLFTTGIQQSLVRISGQPYRTKGVGGKRLLDEVIPGQYTAAKMENPDIKTVVMTGGGNDIIQVPGLRADCDAGGEMCNMVVEQILDRLELLWAEMAMDGVQDVIYVEYSNPEGKNVDFALPSGDSAPARCAAVPAPLRCHILETLDIVMGDIPDGVHPSAAGYDRIGKAVHELMISEGMRR